MAVTTMIGAKIHRREDPRLVSGEGRYIDDFTRPGTVYLSVVRSPHAHALIKSVDITAASKAPGVVAIYTHKDFAKVISGTMPAAPAFVAEKKQIPPRFPIAEKEVVYQGEPVAVVLTEAKYQSMDAANLIEGRFGKTTAVLAIKFLDLRAGEMQVGHAPTGVEPEFLPLGRFARRLNQDCGVRRFSVSARVLSGSVCRRAVRLWSAVRAWGMLPSLFVCHVHPRFHERV